MGVITKAQRYLFLKRQPHDVPTEAELENMLFDNVSWLSGHIDATRSKENHVRDTGDLIKQAL